MSLGSLGRLAFRERDYVASRSCLAECLALCLALDDRRDAAPALEDLAALAEAQGQPHRAARLHAASDALRASIGAPLSPSERAEHDRNLAALRATLGAEAFDSAWAAGRALTWEQAIEYALEETAP